MFCLHFVVVCVEQWRENDVHKFKIFAKHLNGRINNIDDKIKSLNKCLNCTLIAFCLLISFVNF